MQNGSISESLKERLKLVEERAEAARCRVEEMEAGHLKLQDIERAAATHKREAQVEKSIFFQLVYFLVYFLVNLVYFFNLSLTLYKNILVVGEIDCIRCPLSLPFGLPLTA